MVMLAGILIIWLTGIKTRFYQQIFPSWSSILLLSLILCERLDRLAVLIVLLVSIMAAFAVHRMKCKLSGFVKTLLLLGMMILIYATLLPNYKLYNSLNNVIYLKCKLP